ncbi:MAG: hypothetical protein ACTSX7_02775, partial [Alphaproteobacteria bacterium]
GPTQFSFQVPADAQTFTYGTLFSVLKEKHDATLFGVAESTLGNDLTLNAPSEFQVDPGMIVYFMAAKRIEPTQIDWTSLVSA